MKNRARNGRFDGRFVVLLLVLCLAGNRSACSKSPHRRIDWSVDRADGLAAAGKCDYVLAEKLLKDALACVNSGNESDPRLLTSLGDLATVYANEQKYAAARPLYLRVLKIKESQCGADSPNLIGPLNDVVRVTCAAGVCYDTIPQLKRLLSIRQKAFGQDSRDVSVTLLLIAEAYEKHAKYDQAIDYFKQAIATEQRRSGKNSRMVRMLSQNLQRVYKERLGTTDQPQSTAKTQASQSVRKADQSLVRK